ncbi:hypothetical protein [Streptomyces sp. NPDC088135]|uniref:hypothetical protein n=1 Tax=Streptomyces sp. NPDC088135 TaxID=3160993 RepID=UPI00342806FE
MVGGDVREHGNDDVLDFIARTARDDVLDFIARTARDDLAVAEIEGTTKKAVAIRTAFNCALDSAKEAAVIALPARKTA